MKKQVILWILVLVLLVGSVTAQTMGERVRDSFAKLGDFEQIYDKNPALWDFVFFGAIFALVTWLGLSKWFGETNKGAAVALAIVLGALLGLGAVKGGLNFSIIIPFVKNAFFFIVAAVLFFIMINTFLKEHKIIAFVLAIVISFVIFNMTGFFTAVDTQGWLEFGEEKNMGLEKINRELDNLARDFEVKDAEYEGFENGTTEVGRINGKVGKILVAIDKKIDKEQDEEKKEELEDRRKYLDELKDAGRNIAVKDDSLMKQLLAAEKEIEEIEKKVEDKIETEEEKKELLDKLVQLKEKIGKVKIRNSEME